MKVCLILICTLSLVPFFSSSSQVFPPASHISISSVAFNGIYQAVSPNWAGYVISGNPNSVINVQGSWVMPVLNCQKSPSGVVANWVGIDGWESSTVEQIGTGANCDSGGDIQSYFAWYEFYPQGSVSIALPVYPNDVMWARVHFANGLFTLYLQDFTQGWGFVKSGTLANAQRSSAEWINEAYCISSGGGCQEQPLAAFGTVLQGKEWSSQFPKTEFATIGSHVGDIGSFTGISSVQVINVKMEGCSISSCQILASNSKLSDRGSSFQTNWMAT